MSQRRYDRYKDSAVDSIGEVPAHWCMTYLKHLTDQERPIMYGIVLPGPNVPNGVPIVKGGDVKPGRLNLEQLCRTTYEIESGYARSRLKAGDIVISIRGTVGEVERVPAEIEGANLTQDAARVAPAASVNATWLSYVLKAKAVVDPLLSLSLGAAVRGINIGDLKRLQVALPTSAEQRAIATFLDHETAKIDDLVAEQQRLIVLLTEKRQAVISHAVTKGLDPDVPMKESGVEWLGEVPAHWDVMPVRLAAKLESGHTPSRSHPEYWLPEECIVPWFTLADVWQIRAGDTNYVYETKEMVSEVGLANSAARILPRGTVMLSRTASVGFSTIMGIDMATTQDFANWVCRPSLLSEYLLWTFRAMASEFERIKYGSTHNTIYMPDLQAMRFARPPVQEQRTIVDHVEKSVAGYRYLIDESKKAVALLQERRTALISAAVTGQIDVCERIPAEVT